jgi:hypothetical protein
MRAGWQVLALPVNTQAESRVIDSAIACPDNLADPGPWLRLFSISVNQLTLSGELLD